MRVGIIDSDLLDKGTQFPNLALMKLSGYFKGLGHTAELIQDYSQINDYDQVFLSKVFNYTKIPIDITHYKHLSYSGTGFLQPLVENLPHEIEHHMPDYNLYSEYINGQVEKGVKLSKFNDYLNYSIGFTTRGCFRKCSFCVNKKYDKALRHSPVSEFLDSNRKYIHLLDDNVLAYERWDEVFEDIARTNKPFQFRQGLDIRLMTNEKAEVICKSKYHKHFVFAFDSIRQKEIIEPKLKLWRENLNKFGVKKDSMFYVLCAFESQDIDDVVSTLERIRILMEYQFVPYIMRYEKYKGSKFQGIYTNLARWTNQYSFFKRLTFREYILEVDCKGRKEDYAAKRHLLNFEKEYPEIANKYFNLRYSDFKEVR